MTSSETKLGPIPESLKDLERECGSLFATCSKTNETGFPQYWHTPLQQKSQIKVFEIPDACMESDARIDEFKTDQYHPLCCKIKSAFKVSHWRDFCFVIPGNTL